MLKKILKNVLILGMILMMISFQNNISQATESGEIKYTETLENFNNPERGFYNTLFLKLLPTGNKAVNPRANLTHLRIGIQDFSGAVNGNKDLEFTEDALNALNETLGNARKNGCSIILRFAYDNFNGKGNSEPSLAMILKHISQLKPVLEANQDVISYIELGFFGPWGEMHTSSICTTDNVSKAIDAMLDAAPEKIKIGVRTPNYYVKWLGIDRKDLNQNVTQKGTKAYRVGLYNDGYLGSESDLGTFANREIEIAWLENQAKHTLYGGEVVANFATGTPLNTAKYMSKEAFRTHTTYLNAEWNNTVINAWKNEVYDGEDKVYAGQTGYTYIANHLGYRFVLRNSEIANSIKQNEKLKLNLKMENVGFANLVNDKVVSLVFTKDGETHEIKTNVDATKWNSTEVTNINFETDLPENMSLGDWKVYLRISESGDMTKDNNYKCIRLANEGNMWDENLGANYIGKFTLLQKDEDKDDTDNKGDNNVNDDKTDTDNKDDDNVNDDKTDTDNKDDDNVNDDKTDTDNKGDDNVNDDKTDTDNKGDDNVNDDKTDTDNKGDDNVNDDKADTDSKGDDNVKDDKTDTDRKANDKINDGKQDENNIVDQSKDDTFTSKILPHTGGTRFIMVLQLLIVLAMLWSIHVYEKMEEAKKKDTIE